MCMSVHLIYNIKNIYIQLRMYNYVPMFQTYTIVIPDIIL